jgi:hypothetical protein
MMVNNCSTTVNYCGILTLEIIGFFTAVIYHGKLPWYFYNIGHWCNVREIAQVAHIFRDFIKL